jgi:2-keto-3-deoxy-galactonokinase
VLDRKAPRSNTSFLSGLLIGTELGTLRGSDVAILLAAGKSLRASYTAAAGALGLGPRLRAVDSEGLSTLGQSVLLKRILR